MNTDNQSFGSLVIHTFTGDDALPISQSLVRISGAGEYNSDVKHTLMTDEDGTTRVILLPTPAKSNSLTPDSVGEAYAIYDVEVTKSGYYTKLIRGVAVFSGIESVLTVGMIPNVSNENGEVTPRGNLYTDIPENYV